MSGDIIILQMYTINHNHMMYSSWDMERDRQNFSSFWTVFCPFIPLTVQKIKILKKWKKTPRDIIIIYKITKNHDHTLHCSWDTARDGCIFIFHFGLFFALLPSQRPKKIKILKNGKKHLEMLSFYTCEPKIIITWCTGPEIWCATDVWTEGKTDRQSDIYRWDKVTYKGGCLT